MIKIEAFKKENGVITLAVTSNDPTRDKDQLDLIGSAILSKGEKRGGYKNDSRLEVSILDSQI